jgi:hypothetical protein
MSTTGGFHLASGAGKGLGDAGLGPLPHLFTSREEFPGPAAASPGCGGKAPD